MAVDAPEQFILAVEFRSGDGRLWHAVGGGPTVAAALRFAQSSCPENATWDAVCWADLYGE
jgi:hypothetical protein